MTEAVEEAARVLYERPSDSMAREHPWADADWGIRRLYLEDAAAALEVAMPFVTLDIRAEIVAKIEARIVEQRTHDLPSRPWIEALTVAARLARGDS